MTVDELNSIFSYKDGRLFWANGQRAPLEAGAIVTGSRSRQKYRKVQLRGKSYFVHHIVWWMFNGSRPKIIDHIDGNGLNNKIENLREVTHAVNAKNRPKQRNTRSGRLGVHKLPSGKYKASIKIGGTSRHIGVFDDQISASEARRLAEIELGFHPNHNRGKPV